MHIPYVLQYIISAGKAATTNPSAPCNRTIQQSRTPMHMSDHGMAVEVVFGGEYAIAAITEVGDVEPSLETLAFVRASVEIYVG
jgi:hypothetical protein